MFSSKSYLEKKTGPYGIGRLSFLQSLVVEYQDTTDSGINPSLSRHILYTVNFDISIALHRVAVLWPLHCIIKFNMLRQK